MDTLATSARSVCYPTFLGGKVVHIRSRLVGYLVMVVAHGRDEEEQHGEEDDKRSKYSRREADGRLADGTTATTEETHYTLALA